MIYDIYHKTKFNYQDMVTFSHNIARLKPKELPSQTLLDFTLDIHPKIYENHEFTDLFGNNNNHILIREEHNSLEVIGRSKVQIFTDVKTSDIQQAQTRKITYDETLQRIHGHRSEDLQAKIFMLESQLIPAVSKEIQQYALQSFYPKRDLFEAAFEFMQRIYADFEFVAGFSDITTPIAEIFEAKKGVCQDFAQFAISALRGIGLSAKYVSGYIETLPPKGQKKLFGIDASHAWFSLYIPDVGWIPFDPTNNIIPKEQHIILGHGRDYHDISPLKGVVLSSGASKLSVTVDVRRVPEKEIRSSSMMQQQVQSSQQ